MIFTVAFAALASLTNKGLCRQNCYQSANAVRRVTTTPCCIRSATVRGGRSKFEIKSSQAGNEGIRDTSVAIDEGSAPNSRFENHLSALDSILGLKTEDESADAESVDAESIKHPFMGNYNQETQDKLNRVAQRCKMLAEKLVRVQKFTSVSKKLEAHRELQAESNGFLTADVFFSALELLKASNWVIEDVKDYKIRESLEAFKDDIHREIKQLQKSVVHFVIKNKAGKKMEINYDTE